MYLRNRGGSLKTSKSGSKTKAKTNGTNGSGKLSKPENSCPKPYDESKASDHFWKADSGDELLPKRKGFITDCVFRHRGKQVSVLFTVWTTLFVLSSAIKREAWLRFGGKKLYTNHYYILVGPAGIAHKTEAINDATGILEGFGDFIENPEFKIMKALNIVADKASPEAILEAFQSKHKPPRGVQGFWFKDAKGQRIINPATQRPMWYSKTSEVAIIAHEFTTLAGQQNYNKGLIDNLLALYDCERPFTWRTVKRGRPIVFKNLHTTLIAGATLTAFRESLSENVRSAGFLSRSVVVYCPSTPGRRFPRPKVVEEAPQEKELQQRLAWIAEHAVGEFDLTPDADAYYGKWYCKWWDDLESDTQFQGLRSRIHVLVLKIALLLRAQRYELGPKLIDIQDVKDAILLIKKTWFEALPVMRGFENPNAKPFIGRMEEYIRTRSEVDRLKLFRQGKFNAVEIREGITMLCEEGKVEIWKGKESRSYPSSDGKEVYRWCGERWLGSAGMED